MHFMKCLITQIDGSYHDLQLLTQTEKRILDLKNKFPEVDKNFTNFLKIGEGTFSTVYQGSLSKDKNLSFAFKVLVATSSPIRVEKEIQILKLLNGKYNVISLYGCLRSRDTYVLVMPNFQHQKFQSFYRSLTPKCTRHYLTGLIAALTYIHKFNIIHRDIKPSNFLYDRLSGRCRLVDFGLAQFAGIKNCHNEVVAECFALEKYFDKNGLNTQGLPILCMANHKDAEVCNTCISRPLQHSSRAGTPGFRAPEVLMKHTPHTVLIDIWATGVIYLSILTGRYPLFKSQDDMTALSHITSIMGTNKVKIAAKSMHKIISCEPFISGHNLHDMCCQIRGVRKRVLISDSKQIFENTILKKIISPSIDNISSENNGISPNMYSTNEITDFKFPLDQYSNDAYDLLERMLTLNPQERISAEDALRHNLFTQFQDEIN